MKFRDRSHAGLLLGAALVSFEEEDPIVVGLARGGIVVAAEVSRALHAPLDFLCCRKICADWLPESAIGAVAPDDIVVLNHNSAREIGVPDADLAHLVVRARLDMESQTRLYRSAASHRPFFGELVIIVDDGLATGLSALAAVRSVRLQCPAKVVVASPVGSAETVQFLAKSADHVVCLTIPELLCSVSAWYDDFTQVDDAKAIALLVSAQTPTVSSAVAARPSASRPATRP